MKRAPAVASTAAVLMMIWLGLTMTLSLQEVLLGVVVSILVAAATHGSLTGNALPLLSPGRLIAALGYVAFFMGQMVKANIDIFLRVFRPVIPIRPGIVEARLRLKSPRARAIVANSITLTPGTLTMDMKDDRIFVHWVFLPEGDVHKRTQEMVDSFAGRLEKIFE